MKLGNEGCDAAVAEGGIGCESNGDRGSVDIEQVDGVFAIVHDNDVEAVCAINVADCDVVRVVELRTNSHRAEEGNSGHDIGIRGRVDVFAAVDVYPVLKAAVADNDVEEAVAVEI